MRSEIALAVALGYALAACAPSHGAVLCIARGEHVAIEQAAEGSPCDGCIETARSPATTSHAPSHSIGEGSCPCIDMSLPDLGRASRDEDAKARLASLAASVIHTPLPDPLLLIDGARSHEVAYAQPAPPIRSTPRRSVLRI